MPVIGWLVGMLACSFAGAFLVEYLRLSRAGEAAHIATGAVIARVAVVFLKVAATLGMIFALALGMLLD